MIAVDTNVLIWGLRKQPAPERPDLVDRCEALLRNIKHRGEGIMIPSVVLAEYLIGCPDSIQEEVKRVVGKNYFIAPFDTKASIITAQLFKANSYSNVKAKHPEVPRQCLKADYKILGTAIAAGVHYLYADDAHFPMIADTRIIVRPIPDLEDSGVLGPLDTSNDGATGQPQLPGMTPELEESQD